MLLKKMFDVTTSGGLESSGQYKKKVHIAYDQVSYRSEADLNVLVQIEPSSVLDIHNLIKINHQLWDVILTWNEDLLRLPNAHHFLFGSCWIDWSTYEPNKQKHCSFITSDKSYAPGHKLRQQVWDGLQDAEDLNGFTVIKHKSPPRIPDKNFLFETAKYHITIENEKTNNWITEKTIDCFASKTVPILWGAPNIGEYFNTDGIITFDTIEELKDILDNLDESFYDDKQGAIQENYERSKQYWDFHARVRTFIEKFIENNND